MRRCRGCYLPMRHDFLRNWWECWLCGDVVTGEALSRRSRLRRWIDRVTGLES